ncbi:MAG TPA: hypothetical protein PK052_06835 [Anaerohalosphaeraceae bacterium]|mgnify:CR=1 FL=1|nr:hypothetical protein [Anaerohalosphaeraceae bacterium]HOL31682.1 hypothetical protein [Anaerohalosphaeraceae bacterium]
MLGPELIANGDFSSATGWSIGNGWTISDGKARYSGQGDSTTFRTLPIGAPQSLTIGQTYRVTYTLSQMAMQMDAGGVYASFDQQDGTRHTQDQDGTYTDEFVYTGSDPYLYFKVSGVPDGVSSFDLDNVSLRQVIHEPIIEQIAEDIKATVAGITIANGYHQDLTPIRPRRNDFADVCPSDGIVLIWQEDDDPSETAPPMAEEFFQEFMLIALVIDSDAATDSIDTRLNRVKSDLRKALQEDVTRSGLAINTVPGPSRKFDDGSGFSGIAVTFVVHYRTQYNDPYTQI